MLNYTISERTEEQVKYKKSHFPVNMACIWINWLQQNKKSASDLRYSENSNLLLFWLASMTAFQASSTQINWQLYTRHFEQNNSHAAHHYNLFKNHNTATSLSVIRAHSLSHQICSYTSIPKIHRFQTEVFILYAHFTKQEDSKQNLKQKCPLINIP